jgi:hypothetical protein
LHSARILLAIAAALAAAACSAPGPSAAPDQAGPHTGPGVGFGHIHGIDLNPADGLIYAATHTGVFRLSRDGPQRIADRYQDTMGFVVAGPDRFLGSGHPDPREPGPRHLGLILSTDKAQTWTTIALRGEADFHSLTVTGATVYGFDSIDGVVMRSDDYGQNWQRGATVSAADLDVDPANPTRVLATTPDGLMESTDAGLTFNPSSPQPPRPLVMVDHVEKTGGDKEPVLAGVDESGGIWALGGAGWSQAGALPGAPQAFTVLGADRYVAATETRVLGSENAGRTWSLIAATRS